MVVRDVAYVFQFISILGNDRTSLYLEVVCLIAVVAIIEIEGFLRFPAARLPMVRALAAAAACLIWAGWLLYRGLPHFALGLCGTAVLAASAGFKLADSKNKLHIQLEVEQ